MKNLILNQDYGRLYEEIYKGKCEIFEFQNSLGSVKHLFMKRKIPFQIEEKTYYDLITPYTYGGPVIEAWREEDKWDLMTEFQLEFQKYCKEQNIVSEFVRFHPLLCNSMDFLYCYELSYVMDARGISILTHIKPTEEGFSVEGIAKVLEAFKCGVDYEIFVGINKIDDFNQFLTEAHGITGSQVQQYFEGCKQLMEDHVVFIETKYLGKVVGMMMCFLYDGVLTTHVLVTDETGDRLNAAFVMHYGLTIWSKTTGVEMLHLAGNWINKCEEEHAAFKNNFEILKDYKYFIGRKVWNEEVYRELCDQANVDVHIDYFPAYRIAERADNEVIF